jgi:hypothetical protein
MANKALPLIIAGGAAVLLLGGKKKKKKSRGCDIIRTDEDLVRMLSSQEYVEYPVAFVVYPSGKKPEGEALCQELSRSGSRTVVMASEHMNEFISKFYEESGMTLPRPKEQITDPGVAVVTAHGERMIPWNEIPWNDVKSILM